MTNEKRDTTICKETNRGHIRVTKFCNCKCIFCLASEFVGNEHFESLLLKKEIDEAKESGINRIVFSGGEPTIHPEIVELVKYAKKKGINYIQVISNGKRFSSKEFTKNMFNAGLTEATFSLHGNNSELHDYLVGVKGSFNELIQGIKNVLAISNSVVSVDIAILKPNYKSLPKIVDLLHSIGFYGDIDFIGYMAEGRGGTELFPIYSEVMPYLNKAIRKCEEKKQIVHILRVEGKYLDGILKYKEEPKKMIEEMLSKKKKFENNVPDCFGIKCDYCGVSSICPLIVNFNEKLSNNFPKSLIIENEKDILKAKKLGVLTVVINNSLFNLTSIAKQNNLQVKININENELDLVEFEYGKYIDSIEINLKNGKNLENLNLLRGEKIGKIIVSKSSIENVVNLFNESKKYFDKMIIELYNPAKSYERMNDLKQGVLIIDTKNEVVKIKEVMEKIKPILNDEKLYLKHIPACVSNLSEKTIVNDYYNNVPIKIIGKNRVIPEEFARFIQSELKIKILACEKCSENKKCNGIFENYLRFYGFSEFKKI